MPPSRETFTLPRRVHLAETEKGDIQTAATVKVELRGRVDHATGVARKSEQHAVEERAAVCSVLNRLIVPVGFAARGHQLGHAVRDAETES